MKSIICAGNWKLFKNPSETRTFLAEWSKRVEPSERSQFVIFPTALCAAAASEQISGVAQGLRWGLQNAHFESQGAFTGENSLEVAKSMGANFVLVGHSERRQLFAETDQLLARKFQAAQLLGLTPILCVGETLGEREYELTAQVVEKQLREGLSLAKLDQTFWIAYEPVWAIGTGKVAKPEQAEEVHRFIRDLLAQMGVSKASQVPLLYGGSVKPDNAKELAEKPNIDGFLVGGASLDPASFVQIYRNALS